MDTAGDPFTSILNNAQYVPGLTHVILLYVSIFSYNDNAAKIVNILIYLTFV